MIAGRLPRVRASATEYVSSADVLPKLVEGGMTSTEATGTLSRVSARLRRSLRLDDGEGPILLEGELVKVIQVAGVIRLARGLELDVAPKFIGLGHNEWREDLLAVSNYTQKGAITPQHVRAAVGAPGDLASLIGRAFVDEFWKHYRKPLRLYRQQRWRDFSLDGELDTDELDERSPDGLPQQAVVLDRRNPYNALLAQAAEVLVADARDPAVRAQLMRVRTLLGGQGQPPRVLRPVPPRHQPWALLVDLSQRIVTGADLTLHADRYEAPGFVVRTEEAWERLTFLALRRQLGYGVVAAQERHEWGFRGGAEPILVKPDVTIADASAEMRLVDAKYKTRVDRAKQRITQADLMEAYAFMAACATDRVVLLYPRNALDGPAWACGTASLFDVATLLPGRQVLGVNVEVRGFSQPHEHRHFAARLTQAVEVAFALPAPTVGATLT